MASKKGGGRQSRKFEKHRAEVKELKRLGLYGGDLRKPITRHAYEQTKRFKDVLRGKAAIVQTPSRVTARTYTQQFQTKFRKVVIPRKEGEKVFYEKKSGQIISFRHEYDRFIKRIIPAHAITAENVDKLPIGPNVRYVIPIGSPGHVERFQSFDELAAFMQKYETSHVVKDKYGVRPVIYKNWYRYVELEIVDQGEPEYFDEGDDEG